MTKHKKLLGILGIVLAAILLTVGILVIVGNSANDKSKPTAELAQWLGMIDDNTLLKDIVLPGAHDAGTKGLSYLAETQDKNTMELLLCGTRYLDLRVTSTKDDLKIYHGPFKGTPLESVLSCVKSFLQNNPTETVILDFQHFGTDEAVSLTAIKVAQYMKGLLVEKPFNLAETTFVNNLTLGKVRGKCLVVWGDGYEEVCSLKDTIPIVFKRNNDDGTRENCVIHSFYESALNKKSSKAYINEALPHYIDLYKQAGGGLFVLQGQLTDGLLVFGPRFREATHNKNMNKYVEELNTSADLSVVNIVMRDFVTPHKNSLILQLNLSKNLVKSNKIADFEKMVADNLKK